MLSSIEILAQITNYVTDPSGNSYDATTQPGLFWGGFAFALGLLGFGFVLRLARRTGGSGSSDF